MKCRLVYYVFQLCISASLTAGMENEWRSFDLNDDPIRPTLIHDHTNNPFEYHHDEKVKKPFFFIDREHAVSFVSNFKGKKVTSSFNQELAGSPETRNARYYEILARISKERIHLEKYEFYSKDIVDAMMKKVDKNFQNEPEFTGETTRVKDLIENVTKATHLLIVVVLSLFNGHKGDFLKIDEVKQHMNFIKGLWFRLEEGKFEKPPESWEKKVNAILNCKPRSVELIKGRKEKYALCLNFLHYWLEKTGMHVQQDGKISHADTLVEIINKLIYFSNSKVMDTLSKLEHGQPS
ncbi:hypothetical protein PCASD_26470 [Puccinia coronata f. sp. avenae]|uniref:Uncharacterized protein n=1 Tax=Puccinia coronata f. sp. avenae TaxID=200324 RepID=A0A2N5S5L9_9BASI|nr:hypothetical protein PCASD_26470 [Puccinia coronata f. sp. avenae]